jgi:hypothetical protein
MPVIAHHQRSRADRGPDVGVRSLLPDPGLILKPDLDRRRCSGRQKRLFYQAGEVS